MVLLVPSEELPQWRPRRSTEAELEPLQWAWIEVAGPWEPIIFLFFISQSVYGFCHVHPEGS